MQKIFLSLVLLLLSTSWISLGNDLPKKSNPDPGRPKQIILMIGDGMGISQVYTAMTVQQGKLEMARCSHTGLMKTNSANDYITDSAAGGTAIACGKKVNNGVLGITPGGDSLMSLMDHAKAAGKANGFVVTCAVTHATPASFYAHQNSRNNTDEIAIDLIQKPIDFWMGGGMESFGERKDKQNLLEVLRMNNYTVFKSMEELKQQKLPVNNKVVEPVAGLLWKEHPPKKSDNRGEYLSLAVNLALQSLDDDPEGFFLMVEASQIDWAGHARNANYMIDEVVEFDQVIGEVLNYAQKDGNTLVIITADHETGGVSLKGGDLSTGKVDIDFSSFNHTATLVPVFAFGPGAEHFSGLYENTELFTKILKLIK